MNIKNKTGYELLEFIPCSEDDLKNFDNVTGAGVLYKVNDAYLIGFNNWRKQWEIPAGRIEKGEIAREAAIRELYEETHQSIDNAKFEGLFKKKRPNGMIVYMAIFSSEQNDITPFIKKDGDEFDDIILWDLKDDIGYIDEVDLEIIKTIKKNSLNKNY